ncbi:MAG: hypothetical protein FWG68_02930 [Defluviitaleaceae bacterium]|nr:hypothetical protein [Defluviitaleaceae bacterium]
MNKKITVDHAAAMRLHYYETIGSFSPAPPLDGEYRHYYAPKLAHKKAHKKLFAKIKNFFLSADRQAKKRLTLELPQSLHYN